MRSATIDDVNMAICEALGVDFITRRVSGIKLECEAGKLPKLTVIEHVADEVVERVSNLRLREVTGDGM